MLASDGNAICEPSTDPPGEMLAGVAFSIAALAALPPELGAADFHSTVTGLPRVRWLVLFHSPQCGHCAAMMPAWEEAAGALAADESSAVRAAMVDATAHTALAEQMQVNGYPTLLVFEPDGAVAEFGSERTVEAMLAFARGARSRWSGSERHRGYLGDDGAVRPSHLDVLLQTPNEALEVGRVAFETSPAGATLLALLVAVVGALVARACAPPDKAQFFVVECPDGVAGGQTFLVEVALGTSWLRSRRRRVMSVQAPLGVRPGQSFFVPLVGPPAARPCAGAADAAPAPTASKKAD
jgi:thiol-disulfide isomerase/thioredoxin